MLLNIDRPRRTATLHDEGCPTVPNAPGTQLKPVEELGQDGGWFVVASDADARALTRREFAGAAFIRCQFC